MIIISGASGVGKGTVVAELIKTGLLKKYRINLLTSVTTRAPRPHEAQQRKYYFWSRKEFEKHIARDAFIEYVSFMGNYYGTLKSEFEKTIMAGENVLLEIEVNGAQKLMEIYTKNILSIFLMPPSWTELLRRIKQRQTETQAQIQQRLAKAQKDMSFVNNYHYRIYNYSVKETIMKINNLLKAKIK